MKQLKTLAMAAGFLVPAFAHSVPYHDPLSLDPLLRNLLSEEGPRICSEDQPLVYSPGSLRMCVDRSLGKQQMQAQEEDPVSDIHKEKVRL